MKSMFDPTSDNQSEFGSNTKSKIDLIPFEHINKLVNNLFEKQYNEYLKDRSNPDCNRDINTISSVYKTIKPEQIDILFQERDDQPPEYNRILKSLRKIFKYRLKEVNYIEGTEAFFIYDSGINICKTEINITNFVVYLCAGNLFALQELCYRLLARFDHTNNNIIRLLQRSNDKNIFPDKN